MLLMAAMGLLVLVGLAAVVLWGDEEVRPTEDAEPATPPPVARVLRGYVRGLALAVVAGAGAGILVAGAGGRLAMRLLAVTAGDVAFGRVTEAEQIVGRITVGGTLGFLLFAGVFGGIASGLVFMAVRRWLPSGRVGGLVFGALLLVAFGPHVEPLRPSNRDFDIVGPGWVAIVVFSAMALVHGMLVAGLAGRYSRVLPPLSSTPRSLLLHAPVLLLVPGFPVLAPILVAGLLGIALTRSRAVVEAWRSRAAQWAGRGVLLVGALVALPWFVAAVVDIAGRGP